VCDELENVRFFSFLMSGESRQFADQAGQPLETFAWLQCENPQLTLVGEQPGIFAAYVVGKPANESALERLSAHLIPGLDARRRLR
jgi:hypothetical protein